MSNGFFGRGRVASIVGVMAMVAAVLPVASGVDAAGAATAPSVPRNVTAVAGPKTGQMTVKWKAPASSGGAAVTGYQLETKADSGAFGAPQSLPKNVKAVVPCSGVTSCDFRVAAVNSVGTGPVSAPVNSPWLAPHAPKLKTAVGGPAVGQMTVKWAPPSDNGGKAVTGWLYDVRVDNVGAWTGPFPMTGVGGSAKSALLSCSSTTTSGGCAYRIYAQNDVGTSPVSNIVNGLWKLPKPVKISDLVPGRPEASATISWTETADTGGLAVTYRYQVSSDGGPFVNGASSLPTFPRTAIVECPGTNNCSYKVFAQNAKGSSAASAAKTTAFNPPGKVATPDAVVSSPTNLNLGSGTPTVTVTWAPSPNTGGEPITGYQGRTCIGNCTVNDASWASATIVPLGMGGTWLTTCPSGQLTCSYQIRAVNVVGPGGWSPSTRIEPFAVANVAAVSAAPAGTVAIGWTGPIEAGHGVDHLALYRCLVASGCGNSANWTDTGQVIPAGSFGTTDLCGAGIECAYRVVAVETGTGSSGAASASVSTSGSTVAQAPQSLTAASGATLGAVDLAWSPPLDTGTFPVTDYVFSRSINGGSFSADISTGSTATTFTDSGCGAGNTCAYKVAAVTLAGTGPYSNTATAEGANTPSAPISLTATPGGTFGSVDLAWMAPLDDGGHALSGYFLERSTDGGVNWPTSFNLGTSLSYPDTTCGAGTSCTYRVSAVNSIGTGPASNTAAAEGANLSPPLNLTATTSTTTLGAVDLVWQYPANDFGSPILGYEFRYKVGAGSFSAWASTGSGTGLSFTHACGQDNTCTYEVRAYNVIGTSSASNQASAMGLTDHTAPIVTVTTPATSSLLTTATPGITGTAGNLLGDSTSVNVVVKLAGSPVRNFTVTRSGTSWSVGPTEWGATSPLPDGTYTVEANQTDWASNTGTSAANTFTVDSHAPSAVITSPVNGSIVSSSGTTYAGESLWPVGGCAANRICGTASDPSGGTGVATVSVTVQQGSGNYWNGSGFASASSFDLTPTGTTSWSLAFPASNFPAGGTYTVRVTATDGAALSSTATSTFSVDYNPTTTVFVAPGGSGSGLVPASPTGTVASGLTIAQANGRSHVVVAAGTYGSVSLTALGTLGAMTTTGGYSSSTWLRSAPASNTVTISGPGTGLLVDGYTETFQQLTVIGTNSGLGAGSSVYGVRAINSANVTLTTVDASAQAGVPGTPGTDATSNAGNGGGGGTGQGPAGNGNSNRTGGSSGTGVGGRNGGGGGTGGAQGNNSGGSGGTGTVFGSGGGSVGSGGGGTSDTFCDSDAGGGQAGGAGAGGTAPAGGSAGSNPLTGGTQSMPAGTPGTGGGAGSAGHGGGGGGGGGGEHNTFCTDDHGAGGGGGGGGAGGGNGGGGGGNGGSSFGVYAYNATISVSSTSKATAGNGGAGGAGGDGFDGGTGGQAGAGGQCDSGQEGGGGGSGGSGGGGAGGSGGGGGQGGYSVALYHRGTGTATVTATLVKGSAGTSGAGSGGAAGTGGAARASGGRTSGSSGCNPGAGGPAGGNGAAGNAGGSANGAAYLSWIDGTPAG